MLKAKLCLQSMPNPQFHLRPELSKVRRGAQLQLRSKTQAGERAVFEELVLVKCSPRYQRRSRVCQEKTI
jgi:hypothetical protein